MERFEKVWDLLKEWYDLGLATRKITKLEINKIGGEYEVAIPELGAYEYGQTVEEALDKHIRELETDQDYLEYKMKLQMQHKAIEDMENERRMEVEERC